MEDVKKEVTTEELRENVLANISEDVAVLLRERCVELGRAQLYKDVAHSPEWTSWRFNSKSDQPKSAEEYALGNASTSGALAKVPDWASKKAVFEFLRPEFERDYAEYIKANAKEGDGE